MPGIANATIRSASFFRTCSKPVSLRTTAKSGKLEEDQGGNGLCGLEGDHQDRGGQKAETEPGDGLNRHSNNSGCKHDKQQAHIESLYTKSSQSAFSQ